MWTTLPVSKHQTAKDGTAYQSFGNKDKPTVVLIHGLGLSRHLWAPYIPLLSEQYHVLVYDLYGHGDSAPCPKTATLGLYASQIAGLLGELEITSATLIGFSIGGMINRRFAIDYPELTQALVILNSPHDRGETQQQLVEERAASVKTLGASSTLDEALKRWFTPDFLEEHKDTVNLVVKWREQVDQNSYAQAAWVLANGVRELIAPKPAIDTPCLIMTSQNDSGSTPAMSEKIACEILGSKLQIIPTLQHLGLMQDISAFSNPITSFLKGTIQ